MTITEISQKVDKIYISDKDFKKVQAWTKEIGSISDLLDKRYFFPLKTFVIEIWITKRERLLALVELDDFNPTSGRIQTDNYWFTFKHIKGEKRSRIDGEGASKDAIEVTHVWIVGVLLYICEQGRTKIQKVSPMIEREDKDSDTPYEYQDRVCFLLNDIIEYSSKHHNRKTIQYQCECWGVRGHIRHYSDGRTVFIEPYKKGRLRDTLEPKSRTYMIDNKG